MGATLTTTGAFTIIDTANVQTVGTRILVKNEANAVYNGVYTWANATNLIRSTDTNTYGDVPNTLSLNDYFFVQSGNVNLGDSYIVSAPTGTITFGTSGIVFSQFSHSQVYNANTAAGINLIGQTFNAKVDNTTTAFDGGGNIIVKAGANLTTPNIGAATGTSLSVSFTGVGRLVMIALVPDGSSNIGTFTGSCMFYYNGTLISTSAGGSQQFNFYLPASGTNTFSVGVGTGSYLKYLKLIVVEL